jgi:hypothetical protein
MCMSVQGEERRQASPQDVVGVGIAFSAAGLYFILGAAGYLPMPDSNGPSFLGFCVGASFLFAGMTCMVRARAGLAEHEIGVADTAPRRIKLSTRMLAIGAAGALATIGTWIALASGPRAFDVSGSIPTTGELVGRSVFALGAVITWIVVIALTVGTVRKLFDRRGG